MLVSASSTTCTVTSSSCLELLLSRTPFIVPDTDHTLEARLAMTEVAAAAEQFVEKMTDTQAPEEEVAEGEGDKKLTLEERKAKMEKLRQKMVRSCHCSLATRAKRVLPEVVYHRESGTGC